MKSFRIMESIRKGSKTFHETIRFVGSSTNPEIIKALEKISKDLLVKLQNHKQPVLPTMTKVIYSKEPEYVNKKPQPQLKKKNEKPLSLFSLTRPCEKERVHYGIKGVCGAVYKQMGFHTIIQGTKKDEQWNDILKYCVLSRVARPNSKRKTVETLREDFNEQVHLDKMYRMMDRLYPRISRVKDLVAKNTLCLFNQQVDVLFFDVTTLYFESFEEDDLRQFCFSKDLKFKETQVVLALVTNQEGHPLSYELFPGRMSEARTLISTVDQLKRRFHVRKAVLVWDGLHGVITNIEGCSATELLTRYRRLWKIEEAFRVCKHTLKMRPIYHWKKRRIESHIAICFLAYSLSYTMKHRMEQRGVPFSIEKIREVLKRDQYSLIEDQETKKLYRLPSKLSEPIRAIYEAFGLRRVSEIVPVV